MKIMETSGKWNLLVKTLDEKEFIKFQMSGIEEDTFECKNDTLDKHSWNNKTDTHLSSDFYNLEGFLKGETSLHPIELEILGNIRGKTILHLQCHFGQDSISLSRLTGVDLSDKAIESARKIAK